MEKMWKSKGLSKVYTCILLILVLSNSNSCQAEETLKEIPWSVKWQGLECIGEYSGKINNKNQPNGKGKFVGYTILNGEEYHEIEYSGKWEDGKIQGKGILTDKTEEVEYIGYFYDSKMNGRFRVSSEKNKGIVEHINYNMDIPYGTYYTVDEDGNIINQDRFVEGMFLSDLVGQCTQPDYKELWYQGEEHLYDKVKLVCTLESKTYTIDRGVIYIQWKAVDENSNIYVIRYDLQYHKSATNYMPLFDVGDKVTLYGYYKGMGQYVNEDTIVERYPLVYAICGDWNEFLKFDLGKKTYSYEDIVNSPYEFFYDKIELEGKIESIEFITENDEEKILYIIKSSDYSNEEEKYYVKITKEILDEMQKYPLIDEKIKVSGRIRILKSFKISENEYEFYPLIIAQKFIIE